MHLVADRCIVASTLLSFHLSPDAVGASLSVRDPRVSPLSKDRNFFEHDDKCGIRFDPSDGYRAKFFVVSGCLPVCPAA